MTHRTVICVLLVAVVGVALACGRAMEGDPIPQAQGKSVRPKSRRRTKQPSNTKRRL